MRCGEEHPCLKHCCLPSQRRSSFRDQVSGAGAARTAVARTVTAVAAGGNAGVADSFATLFNLRQLCEAVYWMNELGAGQGSPRQIGGPGEELAEITLRSCPAGIAQLMAACKIQAELLQAAREASC